LAPASMVPKNYVIIASCMLVGIIKDLVFLWLA